MISSTASTIHCKINSCLFEFHFPLSLNEVTVFFVCAFLDIQCDLILY